MVDLRIKSKFKMVISCIVAVCIALCFTFNVFAFNISIARQNPEIIIDGYDNEFAWMDSTKVSISDDSGAVDKATMGTLQYQNKVYCSLLFEGVNEGELNLFIKVNLRYKKNSSYIVFVPKANEVYSVGDSYISVEGVSRGDEFSYYVEFAFTAERDVFSSGDSVSFEVGYGLTNELDDYENIQGFYFYKSYDCFVGSEVTKPQSSSSSSNKKPSSTNKTTTTTKKSTTTQTSTSSEAVRYTEYPLYQSDRNIYQNEVLVAVMMSVAIVSVVISACFTRAPKKDEPENVYDEDDKECD